MTAGVMFWGQSLVEEGKGNDGVGDDREGIAEQFSGFDIHDAGEHIKLVLKNAMARTRGEIAKLQRADLGLFDPYYYSRGKMDAFPEPVRESHKDYLAHLDLVAEAKEERTLRAKEKSLLAFQVPDKIKYPFDRTITRSKSRQRASSQSKKKRSSGPRLTPRWRSTTGENEDEAIQVAYEARLQQYGSKFMAAAKEKLDWVKKSNRERDNRLKRLEHILHILEQVQKDNVASEGKLFQAFMDPKQSKHLAMKISQERIETADMIVKLLYDYNLISGAEMAQYLQSSNNVFEAQIEITKQAFPYMAYILEDDPMRDVGVAATSQASRNQKAKKNKKTPNHTGGVAPPTQRPHTTPVVSSNHSPSNKHQDSETRLMTMLSPPLFSQQEALQALQRRHQESQAAIARVSRESTRPMTSSATITTTSRTRSEKVQRRRATSRSGSRPKGSKELSFGGWGKPMSFAAERILLNRGHLNNTSRPQSFQADLLIGQRVDKMKGNGETYSHLLKRVMHE